jgi:hypothetical protein
MPRPAGAWYARALAEDIFADENGTATSAIIKPALPRLRLRQPRGSCLRPDIGDEFLTARHAPEPPARRSIGPS